MTSPDLWYNIYWMSEKFRLPIENMNKDFILQLYSRQETVFTVDEISLLFPNIPYKNIRDRLYYFSKVGKIKRLRRGVYAKNKYNPLEAANKLYTPSYISLETVLQKEGIVFQSYESIFTVSYVSREIILNGQQIIYRKIKEEVLVNRAGVEEQDGYEIATKERAFLDAVFLYKNYHFDNLTSLDWDKIASLKNIYPTIAFKKRIEEYQINAQH